MIPSHQGNTAEQERVEQETTVRAAMRKLNEEEKQKLRAELQKISADGLAKAARKADRRIHPSSFGARILAASVYMLVGVGIVIIFLAVLFIMMLRALSAM